MYKVIVRFNDLRDKGYAYNVGDTFPRDGVTVSDQRIRELSTSANRRGVPLIESIPEVVPEAKETHEDTVPVSTPGTKKKAQRRPRKAKEE